MMRPFTCLCMIAAAGAGLYLYQEKYRAQMLDREISGVIKQIDQSHDRINLLKAEWALLNQPDRLSDLASQHLSLQPLAPTQFVQLADLSSRLPPPAAPGATPAAPPAGPAPAPSVPMAQAAPPAMVAEADEGGDTPAQAPKLAAAPRPAPKPVEMAAATPAPHPAAPARPAPKPAATEMAAATAHPVVPHPAAPVAPATRSALQMAAAHPLPAPQRLPARRRPDETQLAAAETPRPYRPLYAPVMSAFASGASAQAVHVPTVQRASAGFTEPTSPYVGSALGMAGGTMAPPVPIRGDR